MQFLTNCEPWHLKFMRFKKIFIIMKLTTLLMIIGCLQVNAAVFSQTINMTEKNVSLESVISQIEQQSGYNFFSKLELIKAMPKVSVNFKNATLKEVLDQLFDKLPLVYTIIEKNVVINSKPINGLIINSVRKIPTLIIGTVLDEHGEPIAGVNIKVKNTDQHKSTDKDGKFSMLLAEPNAVLQFSHIGYIPQEVSISGLKNPIIVRLKIATSELDQVQILAYGTTTKRLATGSSTTIKAVELMKNPVPNVLQAIQNRVPGVFVQQKSGRPGTPFQISIRGKNSLGGASQPLFIVDGVPYPSGKLPMLGNFPSDELKGGNALDYLDMSMIESIDFLKDADATSIYGSRGAYGVVLITTKKGKAGEPSFNINMNTGITVRGVSPEFLNTEQYLELRREAIANDKATPGPFDKDLNGTWPQDRYTDWVKELSGNRAMVTNANATYSGGNERINFLIGASYNKQKDIQSVKGSNRRGGINFNLNSSSKDNKFYISLSGSYTDNINDMVAYDFGSGYSTNLAPNAPPLYLPDGRLNWETGENAARVFNIINKNNTNNLISNAEIKYIPLKGLTLRTNIGFNLLSSKQLNGTPSTYYNPSVAYTTESTVQFYNNRTLTFEPNVNYVHKLGGKGTLNLTSGATVQNALDYNNTITGNNFLSDDLLYNPSFADKTNVTASYNQSPGRYLGFFGIVNYNWDNKYILNVNGRYDGSTKFGKDNQMGFFGSLGAAWILSEERWFKKLLSPIINFAKIRGSYGTVGGDGINNYLFLNTFTNGTPYQGSVGLKPDALANPSLQWEKNEKAEIALSLEFLKGRIGIEGAYYKNKTSNQLLPQPLSSVTGFTGISVNSPAVLKNWGYELELRSNNVKTRDFSWSSAFNITVPKNVLVSYPKVEVLPNTNWVVGKPITGVKLFRYAGVNPATGNHSFYKGDVISDWLPFFSAGLDDVKDRTEFIDLSPKYYGGFQNTFNYKNFSLTAYITFTSQMGKNMLGYQTFTTQPGTFNNNTSTIMLRRWKKPGDITDVPRAIQGTTAIFQQQNFINSTGAYTRVNYARLNNVNISYTFPTEMLKNLSIKRLSIYLQGQNLLTVSKYGDFDPENMGAGQGPLRVFTGGVNLTF
ncbi:SusC/RagA family TonB-linked outer membrane protein [Pedobacter hiemivivus]|uniref:SusC/RagA family TonB-linked outer membrane protein n=2 Tax=Pedobacter hiemivivus TaxID=2530454 RepID=A0A4R0NG11_9SPHI|nr:SusC/RagA family TonB-linked outer membrane protein [Pedobacter hiemivivus]